MNPPYRLLLSSLSIALMAGVPPHLAAQRPPLRPCEFEWVVGIPQDTSAYRDCEAEQPARLRRDAKPSFQFPSQQTCATAVIAFVVDTSGVPDTSMAWVLETDTPEYAARLVRSLREWRYTPAQHQGGRVRQVVRERRVLENDRLPFTVRERGAPPPPPRPPCR